MSERGAQPLLDPDENDPIVRQFAEAMRAAGERRRAEIGGPPPELLAQVQVAFAAKQDTSAGYETADMVVSSQGEHPETVPFAPGVPRSLESGARQTNVFAGNGRDGNLAPFRESWSSARPLAERRQLDRSWHRLRSSRSAVVLLSLAIIVGIVLSFLTSQRISNPGGQAGIPAPVALPTFAAGEHVEVLADTILYATANFGGGIVDAIPAGTVVEVVQGPTEQLYEVTWDSISGWMSGYLLRETSAPVSPWNPDTTATGAASIVSYAMEYLGYPYVWETRGPASFDSFGFTYWVVLNTLGIDIGGSATQPHAGISVARSEIQPGDLVFFQNTYTWGLSHVGIYIGNNQFIHAENEATGVVISSLTSQYYSTRWYGAIRLPASSTEQEKWIDVDLTAKIVTMMKGDTAIASFPASIGSEASADGPGAMAVGTFYVYGKSAPLSWMEWANVYVRWWVAFDPEHQNGFHSFPLDQDGKVLLRSDDPIGGTVATSPEFAEQIYAFAAIGTRVEIHR